MIVTLLAVNCEDGAKSPQTPTGPATTTVASVIVSAWLQPLTVGESIQMTATAIYSDGNSKSVTAEAAWESSNLEVASVLTGVVSARAEGAAAIIARLGGRDGNQGVTVQPANNAMPSPIPTPDPTPGPTPPPPPNPGLACGVERWFVKTLADRDASLVNPSAVTPISIRDLNALPSHCEVGPDLRIYAEEFRVFEVAGRVSYIAHEDDRDYHLALEDPIAPGSTVVTELADTVCSGAVMSPHLATLRSVEGCSPACWRDARPPRWSVLW